jgi:hypothetical protein
MRRASKTDRNQPDVIAAFRKCGATVQPLHSVGQGCPDLLIGYRGRNLLVEVKDGDLPPSARKLTPAQEEWHAAWRGTVLMVRHAEEVPGVLTYLADHGVERRGD